MSSTTAEPIALRTPILGYVLLLASLVAMSSMGAAMDLQHRVDPFLKLFWRSCASLLVSIPVAMISMNRHSSQYPRMTMQTVVDVASCCGGNAVFMMTFLWSLNHTSIGHAYIFNNAHSLIIVVGRVLCGAYVLRLEAMGTVVGIVGGILATLDQSGQPSQDTNIVPVSVTGDLIALGGAIGGVLYLIMAKKLYGNMDTMLLLCAIFATTALFLFSMFSVLKIPIEFSRDERVGLFGWITTTHMWSELYIVFVCTFVGTLGYICVMKYFDPIVVSVVMLLEPVIAHAMGVVVGVEVMPGLFTLAGTALMMIGTALVLMADQTRRKLKNEAILAAVQSEVMLTPHAHRLIVPESVTNLQRDRGDYMYQESPLGRV